MLVRLTGFAVLSVIIPSHNEENYIEACLDAIVAQRGLPIDHRVQIIVAANGCQDRTVAKAQAKLKALSARGFQLSVMNITRGNKINALNEADEIATFGTRVYLDADVVIGPDMLRELAEILSDDAPLYASGLICIPQPRSLVSRAYAKVWTQLPFIREGVPGIGLYAMNAKGRARWDAFPDICADDRFVRLQFDPSERRHTKATYDWPLPEGFSNLVHVRHRWREGNLEFAEKFPALLANDSEINTSGRSVWRLFRTPFSSVVFVLVYVVSNLRARRTVKAENSTWRRGRD